MIVVTKLTDTEITDTDTCKEATHHHVNPGFHRGDLNDVAQNEKDDTEGQTLATTPPVGSVCTGKSTQERTDGHEGDEDRGARGWEGIAFRCVLIGITESSQEVFEDEHATDLTLSLCCQRDLDDEG